MAKKPKKPKVPPSESPVVAAAPEPLDGGKRWPPPGFPIVEGRYQLTRTWSIDLPDRFARRVEDGSLVLWRPGTTLWLLAWKNDRQESQVERLAHFRKTASPAARELREEQRDGVSRLTYRLTEDGVESLTALAFCDTGHLQLSIYFDHERDFAAVAKIADSIMHRGRATATT